CRTLSARSREQGQTTELLAKNRDEMPVFASHNGAPALDRLILVQVFLRHVVFGNFPRPDFAVRSVFDGVDDVGFESLTFFDELLHALRIRELGSRQSLGVTRLSGGLCAEASSIERRGQNRALAADHSRAPERRAFSSSPRFTAADVFRAR